MFLAGSERDFASIGNPESASHDLPVDLKTKRRLTWHQTLFWKCEISRRELGQQRRREKRRKRVKLTWLVLATDREACLPCLLFATDEEAACCPCFVLATDIEACLPCLVLATDEEACLLERERVGTILFS